MATKDELNAELTDIWHQMQPVHRRRREINAELDAIYQREQAAIVSPELRQAILAEGVNSNESFGALGA